MLLPQAETKISENISAIQKVEHDHRQEVDRHFHQLEFHHHQDIQQKDLPRHGRITIHKQFWKEQSRNLLTILQD